MNDTKCAKESENSGKAVFDLTAPRFTAGCVVLLEVPHVRVLAGETDELVERARGGCVEREVVYACSGELCPRGGDVKPWSCPTPEDFFERWDEAGKRMVCVMLFNCVSDANRFRTKVKELDDALAAGKIGSGEWHCRLVQNEVWETREAEYASEEWVKARKGAVAKAKDSVRRECGDGGVSDRVVVVHVCGGEESERRGSKIVKDAIDNAVSGCREPFVVAAAKDEGGDGLWTVVGARRRGFADSEMLLHRINGSFSRSGIEPECSCSMKVFVVGSDIENIPNTPLFMLEAVCAKLRSLDRKADMEKAVCD